MPKMLCLDLDETLLMPDLTIPTPVAKALRKLVERGVIVTLATGRMFPSAKKYAEQIGLTAPLVVYNGAMICAAGAEKPLYFFPVPAGAVQAILDCAYEKDWYIQLYNDNRIVVDKRVRETEIDPDLKNALCLELGDLRNACLGPTPKLMTAAEPAEIARRRAVLHERLGDRLYLAASKPYLLEMMDKGVNKAHSLDILCKHYGLSAQDAVACGDSGNDLEMLQWAGTGCCVQNGLPEVKEQCDYVCANPRSAGVLEVIERFF